MHTVYEQVSQLHLSQYINPLLAMVEELIIADWSGATFSCAMQ